MIELINADCMDIMAKYPDKHFDLAIVDPPYGIGEDGKSNHSRDCKAKATKYQPKKWDREKPSKEYFDGLFRVSRNQIIWGGNYFIENLYNTPCFIVWDKENTGDFADSELAWSSFKSAVRKFKFKWNGMLQGDMKNKEIRIHPTQKPVALYRWLLDNYAKPGQLILDTHAGSFSSAVACKEKGFSGVFIELDKDYFEAGKKRVDKTQRQYEIIDNFNNKPVQYEI